MYPGPNGSEKAVEQLEGFWESYSHSIYEVKTSESVRHKGTSFETYSYSEITTTLASTHSISLRKGDEILLPKRQEGTKNLNRSIVIERNRMNIRCRALDLMAALDARLSALELEIDVLKSEVGAANRKLGESAIASFNYADESGQITTAPLDGIGGAAAKILELQIATAINPDDINEIKEKLGQQIYPETQLPDGSTLADAGINIGGLAGIEMLTQLKLGSQIIELPQYVVTGGQGTPNVVANTVNKTTNGISGALSQVNSAMNEFKESNEKNQKIQLKANVINLMNFGLNIHNAINISSGILQVGTQIIQNVVDFVGLKDKDGVPLDVGQFVSGSFTNLLQTVLGKENTSALSATWASFNRIYQSGANVLYDLQNLTDSAQSVARQTGEYVAKIGNALRRNAIVPDDTTSSYEYMDEDMVPVSRLNKRIQKIEEGLETVDEVVGSLESITSEVLSAKEQTASLIANSIEFKRLILSNQEEKAEEEAEAVDDNQSDEININTLR